MPDADPPLATKPQRSTGSKSPKDTMTPHAATATILIAIIKPTSNSSDKQ
jgi:hypothetical protein